MNDNSLFCALYDLALAIMILLAVGIEAVRMLNLIRQANYRQWIGKSPTYTTKDGAKENNGGKKMIKVEASTTPAQILKNPEVGACRNMSSVDKPQFS